MRNIDKLNNSDLKKFTKVKSLLSKI